MTQAIQPSRATVLATRIEQQRDRIGHALARTPSVPLDFFIQCAQTFILDNPKLMECSGPSLLNCVYRSAQVGIPLQDDGLVYCVPYWDKGINGLKARFQVGFRGVVQILYRNGNTRSVVARAVYDGDEFTWSHDIDGDKLHHVPCAESERGEVGITHTYTIIRLTNGENLLTVVPRSDINAKQEASLSKCKQDWQRASSPWVAHFSSMAIKTSVHKAATFAPLTPTDTQQIALAASWDNEPEPTETTFEDVTEPVNDPIADANKAAADAGAPLTVDEITKPVEGDAPPLEVEDAPAVEDEPWPTDAQPSLEGTGVEP